jgi:peptidoglycan/LPS O-acetylase OafA/YrhL
MPISAQRAAGILCDVVGLLALAGLLMAYVTIQEQHPLLYCGGLQLVALGTATLVAATSHPQARLLPWLLELPPLRWNAARL